MQAALEYAKAHRERFVAQLVDFLRIPSISTLPEHRSDVRQGAEWVAAHLEEIGMEHVQLFETQGHPIVYSDWLHAGRDAETVLVYAHYDVQPVDPLHLWKTPPFEPDIREGRIYARGAVDDKGQLAMHLNALEAMLATEALLPLNVKLVFEGEEEIGSPNLDKFVPAHRDLLAATSVLISDTSFMSAERPSIPYSVRGLVAAEIHIYGPKHDLHSGGYGGTVHNPASALAKIITALHDDVGHVTIPGFYDAVRSVSKEEREELSESEFSLEDWQQQTGLTKPWGEPEYTLRERIGLRPTCEVNGIWSGFQGEGSKTIIPSEAHAKITMRLVPNQDPDAILALFKSYVTSIAPDDLRVVVESIEDHCWPATTPVDAKEIKAASSVLAEGWGVPPALVPGGGSLPIIATLQRELDIPVIMMGFGLPDSGMHAPNEWFSLEQFDKGTKAIIQYYTLLAA